MGNKEQKIFSPSPPITNGNEIGDYVICPLCHNSFPSETSFKNFNHHLQTCGKEFLAINATSDIYLPNEDNTMNNELFERIFQYKKKKKINIKNKQNESFEIKLVKFKEEIKKKKLVGKMVFVKLI